MNFQTVDVQQTEYVVAVDGSGVNYAKVGAITVEITFPSLPNVVPRQLKLSQTVHADSTHIAIPLENAVFSLPGTATVTVAFVDGTIKPVTYSIQNEFTASPVLLLMQTDIYQHLASP